MGHSNIWNSHPKNYGQGSRLWQCFHSNAKQIGFIKRSEKEVEGIKEALDLGKEEREKSKAGERKL
ncbi:hypothetical protein RJ639_026757 [Escallonia herrerae]|uniref:Uncharacterized protein n=1 Tax=Escallonia herrerae TaxID=1293975 RepID=A0AA89BKV3_9ASTE|nr:hypothetical protein RJ639_026757 [Escallonia herrerae]